MFNVLIFLRATTAVAVASCIKQLTSVFAFCQFWHLQLICLGGIVSEREQRETFKQCTEKELFVMTCTKVRQKKEYEKWRHLEKPFRVLQRFSLFQTCVFVEERKLFCMFPSVRPNV